MKTRKMPALQARIITKDRPDGEWRVWWKFPKKGEFLKELASGGLVPHVFARCDAFWKDFVAKLKDSSAGVLHLTHLAPDGCVVMMPLPDAETVRKVRELLDSYPADEVRPAEEIFGRDMGSDPPQSPI